MVSGAGLVRSDCGTEKCRELRIERVLDKHLDRKTRFHLIAANCIKIHRHVSVRFDRVTLFNGMILYAHSPDSPSLAARVWLDDKGCHA